jgi:large subunit ribosomal protein L10
MNRDQKAAVVEEVATQIQQSEAVFAVDYRGISVPQAAELRTRLNEAGARFRVVKNTLTELAADKAGADTLKDVLEGPTAFTFVATEGGDVALAAKALAQFNRATDLLVFKGGVMNGEPLTAEQIAAIARLPAKDVLHGQLVGVIASPITGLVRGLNALITGLAIQLKQIAEEGMVPRNGGAAPAAAAEAPEAVADDSAEGEAAAEASETPEAVADDAAQASEAPEAVADDSAEASEAPEESPAEAEQDAQAEQAEEEAAQSAEGEETESSSEESAPAGDEAAGEEASAGDTEDTDTPAGEAPAGDEKE